MANKPSDSQNDIKLAWYRSGIVWLGIGLTAFITAVCIGFVYIAHTYAPLDKPAQKTQSKELKSILGMPLQPVKDPSPKPHD